MSLGAGDPEGEGPGFASGSDSSFGGRGDLPITDPGLQVEKLAPRGVGEDPRPASHSTRRLWRCQQ